MSTDFSGQPASFPLFNARFPNRFRVEKTLHVPSQEEIKSEATSFSWCPLDEALKAASPLTKSVLDAMTPLLLNKKKYVFVDSKVQFFNTEDAPVDSLHWHVDGSISVEDDRTKKLGYILLHDMYARMQHQDPPTFLAYQSSTHCATRFLTETLELRIPKCIPSFAPFSQLVEGYEPRSIAQAPGTIVSFDGWSIHRAVKASSAGWRLWVRMKETDHFTKAKPGSEDSYGTVFRFAPGGPQLSP